MIDPQALHGRWIHSHEEDKPGETVYRSPGFAFPRSRGRDAFELRADGSATQFPIAPADGNKEVPATWTLRPDSTLVLSSQGAVLSARKIRLAGAGRIVMT